MDSSWLVVGEFSCVLLLLKTLCPTRTGKKPSLRSKKLYPETKTAYALVAVALLLPAECCGCSSMSKHCWRVCWLAGISVWAKSGGWPDLPGKWWLHGPDPSLTSNDTVTNGWTGVITHAAENKESKSSVIGGWAASWWGVSYEDILDGWGKQQQVGFYISFKPSRLLEHLLLVQKHARDAAPDTWHSAWVKPSNVVTVGMLLKVPFVLQFHPHLFNRSGAYQALFELTLNGKMDLTAQMDDIFTLEGLL